MCISDNKALCHDFKCWMYEEGLSEKTIEAYTLYAELYVIDFLGQEKEMRLDRGLPFTGEFIKFYGVERGWIETKTDVDHSLRSLKKLVTYLESQGKVTKAKGKAIRRELTTLKPEVEGFMKVYLEEENQRLKAELEVLKRELFKVEEELEEASEEGLQQLIASILALKPWTFLKESDFLGLQVGGGYPVVIYQVIGKNNRQKGFNIFTGRQEFITVFDVGNRDLYFEEEDRQVLKMVVIRCEENEAEDLKDKSASFVSLRYAPGYAPYEYSLDYSPMAYLGIKRYYQWLIDIKEGKAPLNSKPHESFLLKTDAASIGITTQVNFQDYFEQGEFLSFEFIRSKDDLDGIKKGLKKTNVAWEVDTFYSQQPTSGSDGRIYYKQILSVCEARSGEQILCVESLPKDSEVVFQEALLKYMEEEKMRPKRVFLSIKPGIEAYGFFLEYLGVEIRKKDHLPMTKKIKAEIFAQEYLEMKATEDDCE